MSYNLLLIKQCLNTLVKMVILLFYNYNIKCRDIAENEANALLKFSVEIDNKQPIINRLYKTSGSLNIILNEPANCEYSNKQFTLLYNDKSQQMI